MSSESLHTHPAAARWDRLYAERTGCGDPATILIEHLHLLPQQGRALELACGLGANSLLLAQTGLATQAWDISAVALQKLQAQATAAGTTLTTLQRDIESDPPSAASYDVIVVTDFLYRPICPAISAALAPGGLLFYSTWCAAKLSNRGPSNPEFLLLPNELLRLFPQLQIRYYREDARSGDLQQGDRDRASLIAQKPC